MKKEGFLNIVSACSFQMDIKKQKNASRSCGLCMEICRQILEITALRR